MLTYSLLPGNCVAIEPGEVHKVVNSGSTELVLTYFGLRVEKSNRANHQLGALTSNLYQFSMKMHRIKSLKLHA